jgi:hypothetical protein
MIEYKMTRQAVEGDWGAIEGAPAREMDLYPPAGEDWSLHSFVHGRTEVVAVWAREKRAHAMSDVYSHSDAPAGAQAAVKTIADMPEPK